MKYLKVYEEFAKKKAIRPNVNNYDWQYFFQEFIDDYGIHVFPAIDIPTGKSFEFWLQIEDKEIVEKPIGYSTRYDEGDDLGKLFNKLKMKDLLINLINRVESMGGKISIRTTNACHRLEVYITTDTFDSFKISL